MTSSETSPKRALPSCRAARPQAVILAAGRGTRLMPETTERPKAVVPIGGRSLLEHQARAMRLCGVERIHVVTGFCADKVREALGERATYSHNADYATTNSFHSFGHADVVPDDAGLLVLNADVLFHPELLERLLDDPRDNVLLADFDAELDEEAMKIRADASGRIEAISKQLPAREAQAENVGVLKLGRAAAAALLEMSRHAESYPELKWVPDGIQALCATHAFHVLRCAELPWTEIDFPHDLARAREQIYPALATALWG